MVHMPYAIQTLHTQSKLTGSAKVEGDLTDLSTKQLKHETRALLNGLCSDVRVSNLAVDVSNAVKEA